MARKTPVKSSRSSRAPQRRRTSAKKRVSKSWPPKSYSWRRVLLFVLPFALLGAFLIIRSFAYGNTASANACATKSCFTTSGWVYDQYQRTVAGVNLTDCHNHVVTTGKDGYYAFRMPKGTQYCVRITSTPTGYSGPIVAYDNRPGYTATGSYEWQIIGANCYKNTTYCGPNGSLYKTDIRVTYQDMAPENNLSFKINNTANVPPPPYRPCTQPPRTVPWVGGMTYINWTFGQRLSSVSVNVTVNNATSNSGPALEYFQGYDASIDGNGQYFGIQTSGLFLFDRFDMGNPENVRLAPGNTVVNSIETCTDFISIRHQDSSLPPGHYTMTLQRAEFDGIGDWFNYYVQRPGQAAPGSYIGGIRFPRANPSVPATIGDGGGSWTEFAANNGTSQQFPVPYWSLTQQLPIGNGNVIPKSAYAHYSVMPQSDEYYDQPNRQFNIQIGQNVTRTHNAATYTLP